MKEKKTPAGTRRQVVYISLQLLCFFLRNTKRTSDRACNRCTQSAYLDKLDRREARFRENLWEIGNVNVNALLFCWGLESGCWETFPEWRRSCWVLKETALRWFTGEGLLCSREGVKEKVWWSCGTIWRLEVGSAARIEQAPGSQWILVTRDGKIDLIKTQMSLKLLYSILCCLLSHPLLAQKSRVRNESRSLWKATRKYTA